MPIGTGTTIFAGTAILGFISGFWSKIQWFFGRMYSYLVVRIDVEMDDNLTKAIPLYCWSNMRRSPFGKRRYASDEQYIRKVNRTQLVAMETLGKDSVLFWQGWMPLWLGVSGGESNSVYGNSISMTFIRGTFDIDGLMIAATDLYNARQDRGIRKSRYRIRKFYGSGPIRGRRQGSSNDGPQIESPHSSDIALGDMRILKWSPDDIGAEIYNDKKSLELLYYPDHVKDVVIDGVRHWLDSEQWYKEKRIPWRRGVLLYGKPGTGKTALIRAIAEDFDLPICVFDLASMSNEEFEEKWSSMKNMVPCIALIEDIDGVFNGRENRLGESGGGLTFDSFLNCLSGVESANGVLVVVTTNNIDTLDPALGKPNCVKGVSSSRPGRMDCAVELGDMNLSCRQRMAERILRDCPDKIAQTVADGSEDTPAQFQERCATLALDLYWESKDS